MVNWKQIVMLTGCLLVLAGVAMPRIYLSVGMIILVSSSLLFQDLRFLLKKYWHDGFSWSIGLLFIIPLISGFYSSDVNDWWKVCQIKAPLLLLPFAALCWPVMQVKYLKITQAFFIIMLCTACVWSLCQYFENTSNITDGYLRAKVLPVLMGNSHIWFSYMVVVGILFLIITWPETLWQKGLHVMGIILFTVFLHLLAAKTGLVFLYGSIVVLGCYRLIKYRKKWLALLIITGVFAMPFIAIKIVPTFKNRLQYMLYDFNNVANGKYQQGSNDGNRVISFKAGWAIVQQSPIIGIGYGDIKPSIENWYKINRPLTPPEEFTPPSNNWLMMWCGVGITSFIILTLVFFYLIKSNPNKKDITWYMLCGMAFFSTLYENPFESQYGIYAFLIPFLIWKKMV